MACCPDSESLAAYLDGQLFPEQRERLEEHLAGCTECSSVIADSVRAGVVVARAVEPRQPLASVAAAAVAVLAGAALLAATLGWQPWNRDLRRPLVAATTEARPVVPRLTGGFRWAPLGETQRGLSQAAGNTSQWPIYAAAEEVRVRAGESSRPDRLAALADAHLLVGNVDPALTTIARALAADPDNPRLHSDLAAIYLARGMAGEGGAGAADVAAALESASRALETAPDLLEARFNRALSLELLGLRGEAVRAWKTYVEAEGDPRWATEAAKRLDQLEAKPATLAEPADVLVRRAAEEGDADLDGLIAAHRFTARRLVERQLLAEWAEAERAGKREPARRALAAAGAIARLHQRQTGDARLAAQVDEATIASGATARRLATAHLALVRGEKAIDAATIEAAVDELRRAISLFPDASVGRRRALIELAACEVQRGGDSSPWLNELQLSGQDDRLDLASQARLSHVRGLLAGKSGRPRESLTHYLAAFAAYKRLGEAQPNVWVSYLLSEEYAFAGDQRNSWRRRVEALVGSSTLAEQARADNIVLQSATMCLLQGRPRVAGALLDELSGRGHDLLPSQSAFLHLKRAQIAQQLRIADTARLEIARAARALLPIREGYQGAWFRAELAATYGAVASSPPVAIAAFSRALRGFRQVGALNRVPGLLLQRALAHMRNGDSAAAERDLREGTALLEDGPSSVLQERIWLDRLESPSRLFHEMAALAFARKRPNEAFAWIERARAKALGAGEASPKPIGVSELATRLGPDTTLLSYAVVGDRVLLWRTDAAGTTLVPLSVKPTDLAAMVASMDADLAGRVWTPGTADTAARLYRALLAPAALGRDLRRLVIVPDDGLATVPFAALIDERGRFVIQTQVVEIAPSVSYYVHARDRRRSLAVDGVGSALVLADPSVDSELFPGLSRLPGAAKELAVAGLYRHATRLTGGDATRDALFMALGEHSVVHLATHALVDDALPSRSALALAPKRRGDGSGALYADEIPLLALPRTRTVVLAACGGNGGPLAGTAGRLSLARAFLAADVPEVVAALWPVGDQRSVALLTALHEGLSTGHDAATALRSAQLQMLTGRDPVLRSPATWALFQALGG